MSAPPFMQLYVGDYLADTLHLTAEQHGAYLLLLMSMWRAGGSLPDDAEKLCRVARISPKRWGQVWPEISAFFTSDGERIRNNRLAIELQKADRISQYRKTAGEKGGRANALKSKEAAQANASVLPKHSQTSDIRHRETNVSLALFAPGECQPDRFPEFWAQYPHRNGAKKGKAAAEKAWAKAIKARASPEQIIAGALRYATDRQVISGYAKDPATWLNAKGWEDEIEQPHNPGRGPSGSGGGMVAAFAAVAARRPARPS